MKVKVTEEDGTPMEGADVTVWYSGCTPEQTGSDKGQTDKDGMFQARGTAKLRIGVQIERAGYYETRSGRLSRKKDHDLTFVLRKIKKPVRD